MDINLDESNSSTITGIKLYVTCNRCKRTWGISLINLVRQPEGWDCCTNCQQTDRTESIRSVHNEQQLHTIIN